MGALETTRGPDPASGVFLPTWPGAISDSDAGRENYFQTFYKLRQELPTHCDVVINIEVLTPGQATAPILTVARG